MFLRVNLLATTPSTLAQNFMEGQNAGASALSITPRVPNIRQKVALEFICESNGREVPVAEIQAQQNGFFHVFGRV